MTDAVLSHSRSSAVGNPWLVAAVVVVPTFMEVLDTTIAVVALRYIAGGLSARRDQFHTLRLNEYLDPFNPAVQSFLEQAQARFLQQTGDPAAAQQLAWQTLENLREQQSSALAYFDCFWLFAVMILALIVVVFVMKRSVAEKGAHVDAE